MCTEAFKTWSNDRGEMRAMIEKNEQMISKKLTHLQTVVNRIDTTVTNNSENMELIEDRTDRTDR